MGELQRLARAIGADERTLRRAVSSGTIRCTRPSPRRLRISPLERQYLKRHWQTIARIRGELRTEPSVRLAVLFGSVARGEARGDSDLDVLIHLRDHDPRKLWRISDKLTEASGRRVDVVHLEDAERSPALLEEILRDGRLLVDRDGLWPALLSRRKEISEKADCALRSDLEEIWRFAYSGEADGSW